MSKDISQSSNHNLSATLSVAKTIVKFTRTHPLYISYIIFFSPYILKLISYLSPFLIILLLATSLCAFSTNSSTFSLLGNNKTNENGTSTTHLQAEGYKIIFETFHDSVTSLADVSDEVEAYKQIKIDCLAPEIVKSCCSSTPLQSQDPPLHEFVTKSIICEEDELPSSAEKSQTAKSTKSDETEIIKHMVCITINKPDVNECGDDEKQVKQAVGVETNKAERPLHILTTSPTLKSESDAAIGVNQSPNSISTDVNKTSRSFSLSSAESMRREKEWTRTLACKLFEERHNGGNGGGDDGMDQLWETYETNESNESPATKNSTVASGGDQRRTRTMSRRSSRGKEDRAFKVYAEEGDDDVAVEDDDVEVDGDDVADEEDDAASGKMCCLQALKMSSGKVNLGIGRKNMMKFSKALRKFGWLHKTTNPKSKWQN